MNCEQKFQESLKIQTILDNSQAPVKHIKQGGAFKDHPVVRPDQSRNYGGHRNIAQKIREDIAVIERTQLVPLEVKIEQARNANFAKFGHYRAPAKLLKERDAIVNRIRALRKMAKDCDGVHSDEIVEPQEPIKPKVTLVKASR